MPHLSYAPPVRSSTVVARYAAPGHTALLMDDIVAGAVKYRFLFPVFRTGEEDDPCLVVTSEFVEGLGACRIGVFEPKGRRTLYELDGPWDQIEAFAEKAVAMVSEVLGVHLRRGKKRPWWRFW